MQPLNDLLNNVAFWIVLGAIGFGVIIFMFVKTDNVNKPPHLVLKTPRRHQKIPLAGVRRMVIGRRDRFKVDRESINLAPNEDRAISHDHAIIQRDPPYYLISDAGSKNGVFVNGKRVGSKRPLYNGDLIRIGNDTSLRYVDKRNSGLIHVPPKPWGNYEFKRFLNGGGMAKIYLGRAKRPLPSNLPTEPIVGRDIALKIPRSNAPEYVDTLLHEGAITKPLTHPNIVKVFDYGKLENKNTFVAMELLNETLRDYVARNDGRLDEDRIRSLGSEIADALYYLHENGLIHCDIKPDNVLFDSKGKPKLTDFGIAIRVGIDRTPVRSSYHYCSPEHVAGEDLTPASDLYMLGCMLYELVVGLLPFEGSLEQVINEKTCRSAPPIPSDCKVSAELRMLIQNLLRTNPLERPQSAHIVKELLNA